MRKLAYWQVSVENEGLVVASETFKPYKNTEAWAKVFEWHKLYPGFVVKIEPVYET